MTPSTKDPGGHPLGIDRGPSISVGSRLSPILLGLVLFVGLGGAWAWGYSLLRSAENERRDADFQAVAEARLGDMRSRLQLDEEYLRSVAGLFVASSHVSPAEFVTFLDLERNPRNHITAVAFAPRIKAGESGALEASVRSEGGEGFHVDASSGEEPVYPIAYAGSNLRLKGILGKDLASDPMRRAVLQRARDMGAPIATPLHGLQDLGLDSDGLLLVLPVFEPGTVPRSTAERRRRLAGFTVLVYEIARLAEIGLVPEPVPVGMRYEILDVNTPGRSVPLHASGAAIANPGHVAAQDLRMGGRFWRVNWEGGEAFKVAGILAPRSVLHVGLATALLLSVLCGVLLHFANRARWMTWRRDAELLACRRETSEAQDAQAEARRALEQADTARKDLLLTLTHEMREPVALIEESVARALAEPSAVDGVGQRKALESALPQLRRMGRLMDDHLDHARLESGTLDYRRCFAPVGEAMDRVLAEYAPMVGTRGIALTVREAPDLPSLWIDPERLRQLLGNLVRSALNSTPAGGSIRIETLSEDRELVISVGVDGPGMEDSRRGDLVRPVQPADADGGTCASHPGTGWSLALAQGLASAMGGELTLAPPEGGTASRRMVVRFPCPSFPEVVESEARSISEESGGMGRSLTLARARLPHGDDLIRLEEWILAHLPPRTPSRVIRGSGSAACVVVICDGASGIRERLEILSRGVFPAVSWERMEDPRPDRRVA